MEGKAMNRQLHNDYGHEVPPGGELVKRAMARHHNISAAESGCASLTEDARNVLESNSRELLPKRGLFPRARECEGVRFPRRG
jgi:hypothetical protein